MTFIILNHVLSLMGIRFDGLLMKVHVWFIKPRGVVNCNGWFAIRVQMAHFCVKMKPYAEEFIDLQYIIFFFFFVEMFCLCGCNFFTMQIVYAAFVSHVLLIEIKRLPFISN